MHEGQRAQPVAHRGRALELQFLGRLLHLGGEFFLHRTGFAGHEGLRLADQLAIVLGRDPADARRGAALDLVQQARPGPGREYRVGTGSQQEDPLHGGHRLVDRPRRGKRSPVAGFANLGAAVLGDLRVRMVLGQHQPGIGFVIPQDDVEVRLQPLDEIRFQQKRLGLGMGGDDFHRRGFRDHPAQPLRQAADLRVRRDAPIEAARLADVKRIALGIQHAVHARAPGHCRQGGGDRRHTGVRHRHAVADRLQLLRKERHRRIHPAAAVRDAFDPQRHLDGGQCTEQHGFIQVAEMADPKDFPAQLAQTRRQGTR